MILANHNPAVEIPLIGKRKDLNGRKDFLLLRDDQLQVDLVVPYEGFD